MSFMFLNHTFIKSRYDLSGDYMGKLLHSLQTQAKINLQQAYPKRIQMPHPTLNGHI